MCLSGSAAACRLRHGGGGGEEHEAAINSEKWRSPSLKRLAWRQHMAA